MIKITTHVLDVSRGCPASGMEIFLYRMEADGWEEMAWGRTNADGRLGDWAAAGGVPGNGIYKIKFETKVYFKRQGVASFYPFVEVHFEIAADSHYHIPLLLSPWGYSTYRGS